MIPTEIRIGGRLLLDGLPADGLIGPAQAAGHVVPHGDDHGGDGVANGLADQ